MSEEPKQRTIIIDIWGINDRDRIWFAIFTILAGAIWTGINTTAILTNLNSGDTIRNIMPEIGKGAIIGYTLSGFGVWTALSIKDGIMGIGDYFREKAGKEAEKNQEKGRNQLIQSMMARAEASGNEDLKEFVRQEAERANTKK